MIRKSVCSIGEFGQESCEHEYYIYDARERMIAVESQVDDDPKIVVGEYKYNSLGWRYEKVINNTVEYFLYGQVGLLGEYNALGELHKEYHYNLGQVFMSNPLFQRDVSSGKIYFYMNDHRGSPAKLYSKSGQYAWGQYFSGFGMHQQESYIDSNLGFPGQYLDGEVSSYYNYYRNYDHSLGRYLQSDPLGMQAGENYYVYVLSNPIKNVDPFGLYDITLSGYMQNGRGASVSFGTDPETGQAFLLLKVGFGGGGGATFDPDGGGIPGNGSVFVGITGEAGAAVEAGAILGGGDV